MGVAVNGSKQIWPQPARIYDQNPGSNIASGKGAIGEERLGEYKGECMLDYTSQACDMICLSS